MRRFQSVKIIHDIIHRADYVYLSELLRFCGIFVCEGILIERSGKKTDAEKNTKYDAFIYIGEKMMPEGEIGEYLRQIVEKDEFESLVEGLPEETIFYFDHINIRKEDGSERETSSLIPVFRRMDHEEQRTFLLNLIEQILVKLYQKVDREKYDFQEIVKIYVEELLAVHSINLQYFPKRKSVVIEEAQEAFIHAYENLMALEIDWYKEEMRSYYRYALLWVKTKINLTCDFMKDIPYFPIRELSQQCRELCEAYPDFSNAKILLGLCYEPFKNRANEAVTAFNAALQWVGEECFAAPVHYWIGRKFERSTDFYQGMCLHYRKANEKKVKFRTLFKLAIIMRGEKKYKEALSLFDEILSKLEAKLRIGFTDPLEIEYIFKTYNQKCYIYFQERDYGRVRETAEKVKQIMEETVNSNRYLGVLYGEQEAQCYKEILKGKLDLHMINKMLVETRDKVVN